MSETVTVTGTGTVGVREVVTAGGREVAIGIRIAIGIGIGKVETTEEGIFAVTAIITVGGTEVCQHPDGTVTAIGIVEEGGGIGVVAKDGRDVKGTNFFCCIPKIKDRIRLI